MKIKKFTISPSPLMGEGRGEGGHPPLNPLPSREGRTVLKFIICLLIILPLFFISCSGGQKNGKKLKEVEAKEVTKGTIEQKVLFTGNIVAKDAFDVYPRAAGKVSKKVVKEGDAIKKGEAIVYVNRDEVGYTYRPMPVVALVDGFVGTLFVDVGTNVDLQTKVATVVRPGDVRVKLDVPERYLQAITPGTLVDMTVDSLDGEKFSGTVATSSPVVDQKSRTANVEVWMKNDGDKLRHGMFGRMNLVVDKKDDVLKVPANTISWEGEKRFVYKIVDGKIARTEVETGLRTEEEVEITSGLNEGDKVAAGDLLEMKDGEEVAVKE